jgi:hypothetical protein
MRKKKGEKMINLFKETTDKLNKHGKSWSDVNWVGNADGDCVYDPMSIPILFDVEYDNGYGINEICDDLVVCGSGWWLKRFEYDGAEGWVFVTMPVLKSNYTTCEVSPVV